MAAPKRLPTAEDAHFRIDEIERRLASGGGMNGSGQGELAGAAALIAAFEELRREIAALKQSVARDVKTDADVATALNRLSALLERPRARRATIHLPSGPVDVTVSDPSH